MASRDDDELEQYNNEAYEHVFQGYDPAVVQFNDSAEWRKCKDPTLTTQLCFI